MQTLKILMLGDSGVGKSSLLLHSPGVATTTTIGADIAVKHVRVGDSEVKLQIWDIGGHERFRNITRGFYSGADGVIAVYDVTHPETLHAVPAWLDGVHALPGLLVGNKIDQQDNQTTISLADGTQAAKAQGLSYVEASARTGRNVNLIFSHIAHKLVKEKNENISTPLLRRRHTPAATTNDEEHQDSTACMCSF